MRSATCQLGNRLHGGFYDGFGANCCRDGIYMCFLCVKDKPGGLENCKGKRGGNCVGRMRNTSECVREREHNGAARLKLGRGHE
jgi:hypothetical protein